MIIRAGTLALAALILAVMFRDTGYGDALKRRDGSLYFMGYRGTDDEAEMWRYLLRPQVQPAAPPAPRGVQDLSEIPVPE